MDAVPLVRRRGGPVNLITFELAAELPNIPIGRANSPPTQ